MYISSLGFSKKIVLFKLALFRDFCVSWLKGELIFIKKIKFPIKYNGFKEELIKLVLIIKIVIKKESY